MSFKLMPMLSMQRELYDIPLSPERFKQYLEIMMKDDQELAYPLSHLNPMAQDHVPQMLSRLIDMGAESIAATAIAEANQRLPKLQFPLQVGLVVVDDLKGGWTNRYLTDMQLRFEPKALLSQGFIVVPLWSSDVWQPLGIYSAVLTATYRSRYYQHCGKPKTLRHMMTQEGYAAVFALNEHPALLDPEDLDYSRQVIKPYLKATDHPTLVACLYGDAIAKSIGYPPMGLSNYAGYAVAIDDAQRATHQPEKALAEACLL